MSADSISAAAVRRRERLVAGARVAHPVPELAPVADQPPAPLYSTELPPVPARVVAAKHTGPFRGIDLLDAVYGFVQQHERGLTPCACGAQIFAGDLRIVRYCPECEPDDLFGDIVMILEEELGPEEPVVRLKRNGSDRWFQFYAEVWFELEPRTGYRMPGQITSANLIAKLEKVSRHRPPPVKEMFKRPPPPFKRFAMVKGVCMEIPSEYEPECGCLNVDFHEAYPSILEFCQVHGTECATCGEDHSC